MKRITFVAAMAAAAAVFYAGLSALRPGAAWADQPSGASANVILAAGHDEPGVKNCVWVLDSKELRLCVYAMREGKLHLLEVRNIVHDLRVPYEFHSNGKYVSPREMEAALKGKQE